MGPGGGQSACVAARPFLAEMGCLPVKTMTQIGKVRADIYITLQSKLFYFVSTEGGGKVFPSF